MAIKIAKADVAQKELASRAKAMVKAQNDAAASKAKVAGSSPAVSAKRSKAMDELIASSADELFPDLSEASVDKMAEAWTRSVVERYETRLAYNAAYQRDLRTIKRLGLEMTVKQYRESLK